MEKHSGSIVIADNDDYFRKKITQWMKAEGHEIAVASDAEEIKQILLTQSCDLLITETAIAGNENLELVEELRAMEPELMVIVATASPTLDNALKALNLPVASFLVKPVDRKTLLEKVSPAVESRLLKRSVERFRQQADQWKDDLDNVAKNAESGLVPFAEVSVDDFLNYTLHQTVNLLFEQRRLIQAAADQRRLHEVCRVFDCPRLRAFTGMLQETVDVLERTKGAFKSKDLGMLRQKIDAILKKYVNSHRN